jgi:hypothetical protein
MFKDNFISKEPIDNIDVYPLMCNILAIDCPPRNGSFERSKKFLKHQFQRHYSQFAPLNTSPTSSYSIKSYTIFHFSFCFIIQLKDLLLFK